MPSILIISLTLLTVSTIQPTTLCGYSPVGTILDVDPSLITHYNLTNNDNMIFDTSLIAFDVDKHLNIISISAFNNSYIKELDVTLPCSKDTLFSILGMPDEIKQINTERGNINIYSYNYDYNNIGYILHLQEDIDDTTIIYMISLYSYASISSFKLWIDKTNTQHTN